MNIEVLKEEFIRLKKEQLSYLNSVVEESSKKILSEFEKLEIYRRIYNYNVKFKDILDILRKKIRKEMKREIKFAIKRGDIDEEEAEAITNVKDYEEFMNMMDKTKNKLMNNKERDFIKTRGIK